MSFLNKKIWRSGYVTKPRTIKPVIPRQDAKRLNSVSKIYVLPKPSLDVTYLHQLPNVALDPFKSYYVNPLLALIKAVQDRRSPFEFKNPLSEPRLGLKARREQVLKDLNDRITKRMKMEEYERRMSMTEDIPIPTSIPVVKNEEPVVLV